MRIWYVSLIVACCEYSIEIYGVEVNLIATVQNKLPLTVANVKILFYLHFISSIVQSTLHLL